MLEEFDSQDTDMEEEREERIRKQKRTQEELRNLALQQGHGNTLSWDGEVQRRGGGRGWAERPDNRAIGGLVQ